MRKFVTFCALFICTILTAANQQEHQRIQDPYLSALKLHGDVSSIKIYYNRWSTKFGERVDDENTLKATLNYDKNHELLHIDLEYSKYFYEYKYNNNSLSYIDCYQYYTTINQSFEFKIRFENKDNAIVSHVYNRHGKEENIYSPYNLYPSSGGFQIINPEPSNGSCSAGNYFYLFPFEIMPIINIHEDDYCDYNSNNQITIYKTMMIEDDYGNDLYLNTYSYEYNSKGQLSIIEENFVDTYPHHIKLNYDSIGNIISIDVNENYGSNNAKGYKYTFEYEYGNFNESEKFRLENFLNNIAKQKAAEDSIAKAAKLAAEQAKIDARLAENLAKKEKWELKLPAIKEFAKALEATLNPSSTIEFCRLPVSTMQMMMDIVYVMYHDNSRTEITIKEFYEYTNDAGKKYNVYCNDDTSSMIFFSSPEEIFLVRKLSDSFQIYDIHRDIRLDIPL